MSTQFNYFASEADETLIRTLMLEYLGSLYVLPKRAEKQLMAPLRIESLGDWYARRLMDTVILVPAHYFHTLETEDVSGDVIWVNYRAFPCLEYLSSRMSAEGILYGGRIAYFYNGEDALKRQVQRMFRSFRRRARKVPGKVVPWIFEDAAIVARELAYPPNIVEPNPLFKSVSN